jgi:hypothetical protein
LAAPFVIHYFAYMRRLFPAFTIRRYRPDFMAKNPLTRIRTSDLARDISVYVRRLPEILAIAITLWRASLKVRTIVSHSSRGGEVRTPRPSPSAPREEASFHIREEASFHISDGGRCLATRGPKLGAIESWSGVNQLIARCAVR